MFNDSQNIRDNYVGWIGQTILEIQYPVLFTYKFQVIIIAVLFKDNLDCSALYGLIFQRPDWTDKKKIET